MMKKSILEVVHESAKDMHEIGLLDDVTMKEFDLLCLPKVKKLRPKEIKQIRAREKISQPILAHVLNVSPSAVKHWEAGDKKPSGAALKLLNIVDNKGITALM
jgi:putative transcriptional regulator